jgi:hypothetical protein
MYVCSEAVTVPSLPASVAASQGAKWQMLPPPPVIEEMISDFETFSKDQTKNFTKTGEKGFTLQKR